MKIWKKPFKKKRQNTNNSNNMKVSKSLYENLKIFKEEYFKDCTDIVYREFEMGIRGEYKGVIICVDGLTDSKVINEFILNNLMTISRMAEPNPESRKG